MPRRWRRSRASANGERTIVRMRLQITAKTSIAATTRRAHDHERGLDAQSLPSDDDVARAIGNPGDAERNQADRDEE